MLKGHIFAEQVFGNQICALFINTFLNGRNGVSNNYKNGMELSYNGSIVTIDSGVAIIQGRILEEDTSTPMSAGTDTAYCKLVIEINLDKQNTDINFEQGEYKIVKSSTGYPALTQNNIVRDNAGVYQYELARFRTNSSGIIDFQDTRTFVDYQSVIDAMENRFEVVLQQLEEELANVEDGSAFVLQERFNEVVSDIEGEISEMNTQLSNANTQITNLNNQKQKKITTGTGTPSGGTNGDIYIQYFN